MRFSVVLPNCMQVAAVSQPWETELTGRQVLEVARLADRLGFTSAFISEHFFFPRAHVALSGEQTLHATVALAAVAGATERIRLGSLISLLPLQHPVVAAKAWSTLDWMSGGRALAGIGVGWLKEEFDVLGIPFSERGRRTDEAVEVMLELWSAEHPAYDGAFVRFDDVTFAPKPVRRRVPLWFGGESRAALHRVARWGDGWCPLFTPPGRIPHKLDRIREDPAWTDRPLEVFYSDAWAGMGPGHEIVEGAETHGTWNAQHVIDRVGELAALGVTETWIAPPALPGLAAYTEHLQWVAEQVIPACMP